MRFAARQGRQACAGVRRWQPETRTGGWGWDGHGTTPARVGILLRLRHRTGPQRASPCGVVTRVHQRQQPATTNAATGRPGDVAAAAGVRARSSAG